MWGNSEKELMAREELIARSAEYIFENTIKRLRVMGLADNP